MTAKLTANQVLDLIPLEPDGAFGSLASAIADVDLSATVHDREIVIDPAPLIVDAVFLVSIAIHYCATKTGQDAATVIYDLRQIIAANDENEAG